MEALIKTLEIGVMLITFAIVLYASILFMFKTVRLKEKERKEYLEKQIQLCHGIGDLELIVEYVDICKKMGFKNKEIISNIFLLTTTK